MSSLKLLSESFSFPKKKMTPQSSFVLSGIPGMNIFNAKIIQKLFKLDGCNCELDSHLFFEVVNGFNIQAQSPCRKIFQPENKTRRR